MHLTAGLVMAADHPWRLDLSSLAAILAALGTVILAVFTWSLARQTRSLARETGEDLRAEWRPALIEAEPTTVIVNPGATRGFLRFRLLNVGRGPAINTIVKVWSDSSAERLEGPASGSLGTLPVGQQAGQEVGDVLIRDDGEEAHTPFVRYWIRAIYEDLGGGRHETMLVYRLWEKSVLPESRDQQQTRTLEEGSTQMEAHAPSEYRAHKLVWRFYYLRRREKDLYVRVLPRLFYRRNRPVPTYY